MGANLSSTFEPDLSKVVLSPQDRFADILMFALWGGAIYVIVMIWTTCRLVDRWKGPNDRIRKLMGLWHALQGSA
ncbi:hypothetical protein K4F52_002876 [Lecanicillium sp. MT-2017a]|nr:hypothetical protein K4F52_002876 [Lecanicillium sp. MT-2017a]